MITLLMPMRKVFISQKILEYWIPLINLHTGEMVEVEVPDAFVFNKIVLHKSLSGIDLLCSVPMMKTHVLARVTLGMKPTSLEQIEIRGEQLETVQMVLNGLSWFPGGI